MNQKIKTLWRKAGAEMMPANTAQGTFENFMETFAAMIVKECAEFVGHDDKGRDAMLNSFGIDPDQWWQEYIDSHLGGK
jgi:hypothetical protein